MQSIPSNTPSSLLKEIFNEIEALDTGEQKLLLLKLKRKELMKNFKSLDKELKEGEILVKEEDIPEVISKNRKERYEQKIRS